MRWLNCVPFEPEHADALPQGRRIVAGPPRFRFRSRSGGRWLTAAMSTTSGRGRTMLNKVPEVTLYFWIIKILCTTVGETASDYLAGNLSLGLTKTTFI